MDQLYLDPAKMALARDPVRTETTATYEALGDGLMFLTPPLEHATEITGPSAAKLFVSSSTGDADLFLVIQVFDPDGKEVVFHGALDPHTPIAQGWLRASHRKLDPHLSRPYRPYHTHDELWPLAPGEVVELDVESGRPASSSRRAIASACRCAARTTSTRARAAAASPT